MRHEPSAQQFLLCGYPQSKIDSSVLTYILLYIYKTILLAEKVN